jgi:hypothetical protein
VTDTEEPEWSKEELAKEIRKYQEGLGRFLLLGGITTTPLPDDDCDEPVIVEDKT